MYVSALEVNQAEGGGVCAGEERETGGFFCDSGRFSVECGLQQGDSRDAQADKGGVEMGCPRNRFGQYNPEFPILDTGQIPENRQLFLVDKAMVPEESDAWDMVYKANIPGKRYVLWRLPEEETWAVGTLLIHDLYWYFECALLNNQSYILKRI